MIWGKAEQKRIGFPCPYMIDDGSGYVCCVIKTAIDRQRPSDSDGVLCAWFYDLGDDLIKTRTSKDIVPKLCPRRYTYQEIDAKIRFFLNRKANNQKKEHG